MNAPTGELFPTPGAVMSAAEHMDILRRVADRSTPLPDTLAELAKELNRADWQLKEDILNLEVDGLVIWDPSATPLSIEPTRQGALAALGVGVATGEVEFDLAAIFLTHDRIRPNPNNPRRKIVEEEVDGIADTIPVKGILQPLLVYPAGDDGMHMLSAGEKRWRAVGRAIERGTIEPGFRIRCILTQPTEEEAAVQAASIALVENGARSDLTMLEKARAFRTVVAANPGLPVAELARRHDIDPRTGQEMLKVLREADPAHIALCEEGDPEWKWEKLRDSVKSVKLSPAQALIVLEVAARMDTEEAAIEGAEGPPWIEAAFTPATGPHMDLVARGILQFMAFEGVPLCRLRTDNPRLEGWLDATFGCEPGERRSLTPEQREAALYQARSQELGSIQARALEIDDKWATAWLNVEPPSIAEVHAATEAAAPPLEPQASTPASPPPAATDDETLYQQARELVIRDRKASTAYVQRKLQLGYNKAASLLERMEREGLVSAVNHAGARQVLAPGSESHPEGTEGGAPPAQTTADAGPTARQRLILAEILHKAKPGYTCPATIKAGVFGGSDQDLNSLCNAGLVTGQYSVGRNGEDGLTLTDAALSMLGVTGGAVTTEDIARIRDEARKDAGLTLPQRHELQQTGRYAWEPLNTKAPEPAADPDQPQLDPDTALALVELAAAIARDGVTLPGRAWRCVAVYDYHLDRAAGDLGFHKLAAWVAEGGQWFGYLKERGERWLKANGVSADFIVAVGCADSSDLLRFRLAAGRADPEPGRWTSAFLNPKAAKPTGPVREAPEAEAAAPPATDARAHDASGAAQLIRELAEDAQWAAQHLAEALAKHPLLPASRTAEASTRITEIQGRVVWARDFLAAIEADRA